MQIATPIEISPSPIHRVKIVRQKHIPVLDGVRAIAVLLVMIFHFFQHGPVQTNAVLKAVGRASALGQMGVDLFFVLSGFLITGILLDTRHKEHALKTFYLRRTFRIFPLYYSYLIVAFLLLPALHMATPVAWTDQWWFWFYCQNIQDTFLEKFTMFGPGHFWSLAVEEHFYLIWPFIVLRLPLRHLKHVLLSLIGLALLVRAVMVAAGYPVYYFTLCRIGTLALGALLAVLSRQGNFLQVAGHWLQKYTLWFLAVLVPFYALLTGASNPIVQVVKFSLFALVCATVLVLSLTASRGDIPARILGSSTASAIAKGSYAMYVFHPAIFDLLRVKLPALPTVVALPIAFLATFTAAWLSWHLLENPCLKLRDWVQGRNERDPLIPAALPNAYYKR
ncbi:MAG: acyltransferase [Acidobacteriaceae bacterium]|nr:acyltransferase [Acidobacteriaceae bacterium]MBV9304920.1 acyltransferase [Acidobacteriaceae bacterium]